MDIPDPVGVDLSVCEGGIEPGPSPIRRLTRVEYDNTVFQLLGDNSGLARRFVPEEQALGFNNQASALVVSPLLAEQYMDAAEQLAENQADKLLASLPSCVSAGGPACDSEVQAFVEDFASRAFRRPLQAEEVTQYVNLFKQAVSLGESDYDASLGVQLTVQAVLQSPNFLYRVEFGDPTPVEGDVVQLNSYEMASRLSYLFWNTMPDAQLFELAGQDALRTKEQIEAQARRLLGTSRARGAVKNFHRQWLHLEEIDSVPSRGKNTEIYPNYDPNIYETLREETENFFDYAIFEADASVDELFTASYTVMNKELADWYGVTGPTGETFERVDMDPARYSGFLSHAGWLSAESKADRSSPIHRGLFVRKRLLCQEPPPPPDVVPEAPNVDESKTTREQFEQHREDPLCAGCHRTFDPIGLGFEHFDGLGLYRETENGLPIDDTGTIVETLDADGDFEGVVELGQLLGNSQQVRECVGTQWFRFSYGRAESDEDACSVAQIQASFAQSGFDVKELLVALTQTDAFRYRHQVTEPVTGGE